MKPLSQLEKILKQKDRHVFSGNVPPTFIKAAVLAIIHEDAQGPSLVLTKRSQKVLHHKGQICLPGGMQDEGDADLWMTAVREVHEEIGIAPDQIQLLGKLSPLITPTGFQIFPFVGKLQSPKQWTVNPDEIEEIFSVPLDHFFNESNLSYVEHVYNPDETHPDWPEEIKLKLCSGIMNPHFTYGSHVIWGATGRIIVELVELVKNTAISVEDNHTDSALSA